MKGHIYLKKIEEYVFLEKNKMIDDSNRSVRNQDFSGIFLKGNK